MEEQLQGLLDRIRQDGVEKAEAEAADIVEQARQRAARIVSDADAEAQELRRRAEADAEASAERGRVALDQAGRDFLLKLQKSIEALLQATLRETVAEGLTPETISLMLVRLAEAYARHDMNESRIDVLVSAEDRDAVADIVMAKYRDMIEQGFTLHTERGIDKGFKVSFVDYKLYHDFTLDAIAEALGGVLKAPLDACVRAAATEQV
jgi:V/A-type H+/Na+-transporting ATPase subunit E